MEEDGGVGGSIFIYVGNCCRWDTCSVLLQKPKLRTPRYMRLQRRPGSNSTEELSVDQSCPEMVCLCGGRPLSSSVLLAQRRAFSAGLPLPALGREAGGRQYRRPGRVWGRAHISPAAGLAQWGNGLTSPCPF